MPNRVARNTIKATEGTRHRFTLNSFQRLLTDAIISPHSRKVESKESVLYVRAHVKAIGGDLAANVFIRVTLSKPAGKVSRVDALASRAWDPARKDHGHGYRCIIVLTLDPPWGKEEGPHRMLMASPCGAKDAALKWMKACMKIMEHTVFASGEKAIVHVW